MLMVFCFDVTGQDTTTLETRKIKKLREENLETFLVSEIAFLLFSRIVHDSRASKVSTLLCLHFLCFKVWGCALSCPCMFFNP